MIVTPPIYVVDVIGEVVAAVDAKLNGSLGKHIVYQYGRSIQILAELQKANGAISSASRSAKYPLFALFQDFPEKMGDNGYYTSVRFPKIVIATLTQSVDPVPKRYNETFKPILYPIYQEFMRQLVRHKNIVAADPGAVPHIKWDRPGSQPAADKSVAANFNDYIDAIEIQDLQLTFKKVNICKSLNS